MSKVYSDQNVYDATVERLNYIYDEFLPEEIWLSLSGGKDSTACFHLMKEVALSRGIKTMNVLIIDLEGHYKLHIDFMHKLIFDDPDITVNGYWVCLPFHLSNASSFYMPKWLSWEAGKEDLWIRPMPTNRLVVSESNSPFEFFRKGMEFEEFIIEFPRFLVEKCGIAKVAQIIGIRAQESYNRLLKMKVRENREFYKGIQWIMKQKSTGYDTYSVHPIYDWEVGDVWKYSAGKLYNPVYDKMYLAGYSIHEMRICQPYGEEQRDNIDLFAKIEPETWARMTARVYGGNFAKIYNGKNVMKGNIKPPKGVTWEQWARLILRTMPPYLRDHYLRRINVFLRWWRKHLYDDIPAVYAHEYQPNETFDADGVYVLSIHDAIDGDTKKQHPSWRRIAKVLVKGDYACKALTFDVNDNEYEKMEALKEKYKDL